LSDGSSVPDRYTGGSMMSPVADLRPVAQAGRRLCGQINALLQNPDNADAAAFLFITEIGFNIGHGGVFDYQMTGKMIVGYTKLREFRDVSNFNVGLFCQQAGISMEEMLRVAGVFADLLSSNADGSQPYNLDPRAAEFMKSGFLVGESGVFRR